MANVKNEILNKLEELGLTEEDIEEIHLGSKGGDCSLVRAQKVESLSPLDYDVNTGYGYENAHSFYIYTENWILLKGTYDGAEWVEAIPRNPNEEVVPKSIGGG